MTLRKGLERLEGVESAKLIMKPPHMEVKMKAGAWPNLPQMQEQMKKAGYEPIWKQVELIVTGRVIEQGKGLALVIDKVKAPMTLAVLPAESDPETAAHLKRHLGELVEVEGLWQPPAAGATGPGGLAISAIYGSDDPKPKR